MGIDANYSIGSVEKFVKDEGPDTVGIDSESPHYSELLEALNSARITYKKDETGTIIDGVLYTVAIDDASDNHYSLTFNSSGELHINNLEKTYTLDSNSTSLYSICEAAYNDNRE